MGVLHRISVFVSAAGLSLCFLSLCLAGATASAERRFFDASKTGGYEFRGPYGQIGGAGGVIDSGNAGVETDVSGGFTLTGGWRFRSWLSAEANFSYLGGGNVRVGGTTLGDASYFAFTFGPKLYPLGALEIEAIPGFLQPYGLVGIGGGRFDFNFNQSGIDPQIGSFISRFIVGLDLWATDKTGLFVEGGYHLTSIDEVNGAGIFTFGLQRRF